MSLEFDIRISDPVHGSVGLTSLEKAVVSTRAFQRLRRVKQLGLASLVFPSADYSRFAHSLGVCHILGRFLSELESNYRGTVPDSEFQLYRLAALVHDLGHYPFSHTTEYALKDLSLPSGMEITTDGKAEASSPQLSSALKHEEVAKLILKHDPELKVLLTDYPAERLYSIIKDQASNQPPYARLISSDLDADRMDYLSRTSSHTGLPYGTIDLDYLVHQLVFDNSNRLGFREQALRTVEHLLLSRWIDYQQVVYNKTVVGLEAMLERVLKETIEQQKIDFSEDGLIEMIQSTKWCDRDDDWMMAKIRKSYKSLLDSKISPKAVAFEAVLDRVPPDCLIKREFIMDVFDLEAQKRFDDEIRAVNEIIREFGEPNDVVFMITYPRENEPNKGVVTIQEEKLDAKGIRIVRKFDKTSEFIHAYPGSLLGPLGNQVLRGYKVFALRSKRFPEFDCSLECPHYRSVLCDAVL
jgi:HD superfamily phosphohydrolase